MYVSSIVILVIVLITILVVIIGIVRWIYIPLPSEIREDRHRLQIVELVLRFVHEYPANIIERIFGAKARNSFTRKIFNLQPQPKCPDWLTIRADIMHTVPVRIYEPRRRDESLHGAALVYIHGGGFATLHPVNYDGFIFALLHRIRLPVISIDYRLAPEHHFPAAVDDCEHVCRELIANRCERMHIAPDRLIIAGDSAGGNLAAVVTQRLAKRGGVNFKAQLLIYPVIHAFDLQSPSYRYYNDRYNGTAFLNPSAMARWYLLYLDIPATRSNIATMMKNGHISARMKQKLKSYIDPELLPQELVNKQRQPTAIDSTKFENAQLIDAFERYIFDTDFCPLIAENLDHLPDAMVITAGVDILRDEGVLYARRLQTAAVPIVWKHYPSAIHGTLNLPGKLRQQMLTDIVEYLRSHLR